MSGKLSACFALPANYRIADILAFHRRDPFEVAEKAEVGGFRKGLIWRGAPACLTVRFLAGRIDVELACEGAAGDGEPCCERDFMRFAERMLGLDQHVEGFESRFRDHALIGPLLSRQSGLRVPLAASPFEALSWAITGQQISVAVAVSLRRKLILAAGRRLSCGLFCYPDAEAIAALDADKFREAGFSAAKAATLMELARLVSDGVLPLQRWADTLAIDEIRARLLAIRGIGPWTVDYALLRGFGWLDGSLHADAAVRRGLQSLLGSDEALTEKQVKAWLADFSPWRALLAAHLWAMNSVAA
ncbi:DNA-3-methyladenine glycosylase family protein [Niveibacterium terrae]|uniref:DNA-3-methyladenine glycosylase family protein n=1 Tax=Niveibacterium terrae TaxID=3373598 RepID=UPI003A8FC5AF